MNTIITAKAGSRLGSTYDGSDWCLKALHPADQLVDVKGIPDTSSVPSVFMNYQSNFTIQPPTGLPVGQLWNTAMTFFPNPVTFGQFTSTSANVVTESRSLFNTQLPDLQGPESAILAHKTKNFLALAEKWRLAYMGITIYQDGPTLEDQGQAMVAQFEAEPTIANLSFAVDQGAGLGLPAVPGSPGMHIGCVHAEIFDATDVPAADNIMNMPNAYFAKSKDGAYIPLRLTKTTQAWDSQKNIVFELPASSLASAALAEDYDSSSIGVPQSYVVVQSQTDDNADEKCTFHVAKSPLRIHNVGITSGGQDDTHVVGDASIRDYGTNRSIAHFIGLASKTSLKVMVRAGWELQVKAGTTLSSQQRVSPAHDPLALDMYFRVSRELKDAYPASYNSLGLILQQIGNVARGVGGAVKSLGIPGISQIGAVAEGIGKVISPDANTRVGNQLGAAAVERAKEARIEQRRRPGPQRNNQNQKKKLSVQRRKKN